MKKEDEKKIESAVLEGAAAETIQRFGSAAREHFVAYSGVDNEKNPGMRELTKGLKSIAQSKINDEYRDANIKQQAGFSAEVKSVARKNADNIINGKSERYIRTDDTGSVNDQLYDVTMLDSTGQVIAGASSQMKFVGKDANAMLDKLLSKKFSKYLENDVILDVPDDFYDKLMGTGGTPGLIDSRIKDLEDEIKKLQELNKTEDLLQRKKELEDCKIIKKNLRKSGLTNKEAIEARTNPIKSTAKDVIGVANKAGIEQAKIGAIVSGSMSIIRNVVLCIKGEEKPEQAAKEVAKDVGKGAAISYATAFSGTVIKGAMSNSSSAYVRGLSKTNLAAGLVTSSVDIGKAVTKYIKKEISGEECVEELMEMGAGQVGSAMFSTLTLYAAQSGPLLLKMSAAMAGSAVGYAAAIAVYREISTSLKEYKLAKEERIAIEAECAEAIKMIKEYRLEIKEQTEKYFEKHFDVISKSFSEMDQALIDGDTSGSIMGNAELVEFLGHTVQFRNKEEFDSFMSSEDALIF